MFEGAKGPGQAENLDGTGDGHLVIVMLDTEINVCLRICTPCAHRSRPLEPQSRQPARGGRPEEATGEWGEGGKHCNPKCARQLGTSDSSSTVCVGGVVCSEHLMTDSHTLVLNVSLN